PPEFLDHAEAARRAQLAGNRMLAALVVGGRPEFTRGVRFKLDALDVAVEREIEIEPRLLAIGDDIEAGTHLIMDGGDHGVVLDLTHVRAAEDVEVLARKLEPAGKRVTADDGGAKRTGLHEGELERSRDSAPRAI